MRVLQLVIAGTLLTAAGASPIFPRTTGPGGSLNPDHPGMGQHRVNLYTLRLNNVVDWAQDKLNNLRRGGLTTPTSSPNQLPPGKTPPPGKRPVKDVPYYPEPFTGELKSAPPKQHPFGYTQWLFEAKARGEVNLDPVDEYTYWLEWTHECAGSEHAMNKDVPYRLIDRWCKDRYFELKNARDGRPPVQHEPMRRDFRKILPELAQRNEASPERAPSNDGRGGGGGNGNRAGAENEQKGGDAQKLMSEVLSQARAAFSGRDAVPGNANGAPMMRLRKAG